MAGPGETPRRTERPSLGWLTARPIAHRGYHDRAAGRIENTASAFAAAIDRNFSIECDLRLTADEEVIVFHDETLDRMMGAASRSGCRCRRCGRSMSTARPTAFRHFMSFWSRSPAGYRW